MIILLNCSVIKENSYSSEFELLNIFNNNSEEYLKPTKWDKGDTTISNEHRLDLFKDKIKNIGGGYIGVGTTQNFTLAAWADSDWIWIIDFTRIAVAANKIHLAFFKNAKNSEEFKLLWENKSKNRAYEIIKKEYASDPDLNFILNSWRIASPYVLWRFNVLHYITKKRNYTTWYTDEKLYNKIRKMVIQGHVKVLKGDLNGNKTLLKIAENAKKMDVTIRVIYLSNAEEYFKSYSPQFRKNMLELPVDKKTVLLRTATIYEWFYPWAPDSNYQNAVGFHYNSMPAHIFQAWMKFNKADLELYDLLRSGKVYGTTGLSIITDGPEKFKEKPLKAKSK